MRVFMVWPRLLQHQLPTWQLKWAAASKTSLPLPLLNPSINYTHRFVLHSHHRLYSPELILSRTQNDSTPLFWSCSMIPRSRRELMSFWLGGIGKWLDRRSCSLSWSNSQVFPTQPVENCHVSKDSALARIKEKRVECRVLAGAHQNNTSA